MAASTDLWGEIEGTQIRTPVSILREQAALLGKKTKNLLEASVKTSVDNGVFYHNLMLVVPALDSYTYSLLRISHSIVSLYPVTVWQKPVLVLETEEDFMAWLGKHLSSPETKRIVTNLLAQVAA